MLLQFDDLRRVGDLGLRVELLLGAGSHVVVDGGLDLGQFLAPEREVFDAVVEHVGRLLVHFLCFAVLAKLELFCGTLLLAFGFGDYRVNFGLLSIFCLRLLD